jgi:hypothetical protein
VRSRNGCGGFGRRNDPSRHDDSDETWFGKPSRRSTGTTRPLSRLRPGIPLAPDLRALSRPFHLDRSTTARTWRRRVLRPGRRGSPFGGIPSFSAAVSETQSSLVSGESAVSGTRLGVAIRVLGHCDHCGGLGRKLAGRHWPQSRQNVVPLAGSATAQRIGGMLPRQSVALRPCSVSRAQPEQWRRSPRLCVSVGPTRPRPGRTACGATVLVAAGLACGRLRGTRNRPTWSNESAVPRIGAETLTGRPESGERRVQLSPPGRGGG